MNILWMRFRNPLTQNNRKRADILLESFKIGFYL